MSELPMTSLCIVGLGRWGKVLVDSVQNKSETVRFVAAVGRDPGRIAQDAMLHGLTVHDSLATALADQRLDGIVLATPHSQHAQQIEVCAAARKPVMVEKPLTLTRASAEAALEMAAMTGTLVAAAHNRRFLPAVLKLKELISAGELGTVLHIETNFSGNLVGRYAADSWRWAKGESPAGGLAGSGIHHIDAIIFLAGAISEVFAIATQRVPELTLDDTVAVLFQLRSGATASLLTMSATAPTYRIQVFGTRAKAEVNGAVESGRCDAMVVTSVHGAQREIRFTPLDTERAELEAFAAAIRSEAPYPVPIDDVLNGVAAFEAVSLSAERRKPVII